MVFPKRVMTIALAVCSVASMYEVAVGLEDSERVDIIFTDEDPMESWDPCNPVAILVLDNRTSVAELSVTIDGRVIPFTAGYSESTSIDLQFNGVDSTVCRVHASGAGRAKGKGAKFIALPGYCYFCTLKNSGPGTPEPRPDGAAPSPEVPSTPVPAAPSEAGMQQIDDRLNLNRNIFDKEKTRFDELQGQLDALNRHRTSLDESINHITLQRSHLTQEKNSLMALRDNMATLQQPGIANELAVVRTSIDTRLQELTKELQAKELALAPLQRRLDNANQQAEELEEKLNTSKSAPPDVE